MAQIHTYGTSSNAKLDQAHPEIARVMRRAIKMTPIAIDLTIVWTFRNKAEQNGIDPRFTNARWPSSYHNAELDDGTPCSEAVDFAPLVNGKIPWADTKLFAYVAGIIYAAAVIEDVELVWGCDFDNDGDTTDQSLADVGHFQRKKAAKRPPAET
jgi:peptidoglycan L-alanyl-D-glutamate endopeptidase CwlK